MDLLIVDDHALFRQGLVFLLSELKPDIKFLEAGSTNEALIACNEQGVDLVLLDLHMPGESGLSSFHAIQEKCGCPIVVLSSEDDPQIIRSTIESGAAGFIPKSSTPEVLIAALKLILAGGIYLPTSVLSTVLPVSGKARLAHETDPSEVSGALNNLSPRQLDVLHRAIQGKANKVIARELDLSEGTVKAHMSASYRALGVNNRTEAVYAAAKLGLSSELVES